MTVTRLAIAGAIVLNVPTLIAATALSPGALVLSALVLAAIGAALGAVTAWGTQSVRVTPPAVAAPRRDTERLAA
jgi:hypothetical protein